MRGTFIAGLMLLSGCCARSAGPASAPARALPRHQPQSSCERAVVAAAERTHVRLGRLAGALRREATRLRGRLPEADRQRHARAVSDLILDLPSMIVAEYADRFRLVVVNEDRLLDTTTTGPQQAEALRIQGQQLAWIDRHYTPLLMSRPLFWINRCDSRRAAAASQPAGPDAAELQRRRRVVERTSADLEAAGRCRHLGRSYGGHPPARREATFRALGTCTGQARRAYRRCKQELLPLWPAASALRAKQAARLVVRLGDLRPRRDLSAPEIAALRERIAPALASFPSPMDELSLRSDAARVLGDFRPRQTYKELNRLIWALERLADPCGLLLLRDPMCIRWPEACRLRPNA